MIFTFTVTVEVSRVSGKFATRDEIEEQLREGLEYADPGSLDGIGPDGDTDYSIDLWSVS